MKKFWFILLLIALIIRVVAAFYWNDRTFRAAKLSDVVSQTNAEQTTDSNAAVAQDGPFFFGDSDSYWKLGRALAFGRPYRFDEKRNWEIFRTPGYPAVLAPLFWIFGENPPVLAARLQGVAFGTLNVALVGWLAFSVFRRRDVAALSGVFVAIDPTLAFQSVLVLSEESFLSFALLQNILALKTARRLGLLPDVDAEKNAVWRSAKTTSLRRFALLGTALGATSAATVYLRPSWYYFLTFATILVVLYRFWSATRDSRKTVLSPFGALPRKIIFPTRRAFASFGVVALALTSTFFVALSPWIVRNYRVANRFIPTSLQLGASLYDGLSPTATGASDMRFVDDFRRLEKENPTDSLDVHFEIRLDERLKNASLDWAKSNPGAVARLAAVKLRRLWSPTPRETAFSSTPLKLLLAASFTPIFLAGLCGSYRSFRRRDGGWTLLLPAFYVSTLHSIFVSSIRYRTPVLYGFSILAAFFLLVALETFFKAPPTGAQTDAAPNEKIPNTSNF